MPKAAAIPEFGAGHRSATAVGAGLEFVLIAFQHLLPEWLGPALWGLLLFFGFGLICWGLWPLVRRVQRVIPITLMVLGVIFFFGGAIWYGIKTENNHAVFPKEKNPETLPILLMYENDQLRLYNNGNFHLDKAPIPWQDRPVISERLQCPPPNSTTRPFKMTI
jgi:hypothetical protein